MEVAYELDGEVTGAGSSMGRCHLDLEIAEGSDPAAALERLRAVLSELGVADCATLNVSE